MGDTDNMADLLTRQNAVKDNRDPRGVKWGIFPQKGRALHLVYATKLGPDGAVVPDTKYSVPEECIGEWTGIHKAQAAIEQYLDRAWTMSEEQSKKSKGAQAVASD
jgi:hypothetical protein